MELFRTSRGRKSHVQEGSHEEPFMEEYRETMKDVYTTSVNEGTLDEAPMAYKSLEDIIDVVAESVDIVEVMKPIYNFKASEEHFFG